jgi:hypothetical protein
MFWVKSVFLSAIYLFVYLSFTTNAPDEVELATINGHTVDNFAIGELLATNQNKLQSVDMNEVQIKSTWIYEKGPRITPQGSPGRNYGEEFYSNTSRFLCWEIVTENPSYDKARDLNFTFSLFNEKGRKLATGEADSWIPAKSEFSEHSACWGWPYGNNWDIGKYNYQVTPNIDTLLQADDFPANIAFRVF